MSTITAERFLELLAKYENFKEKIENIERKYSMSYNEPQLDLPPSLNLPKLTYVAKTEQELTALATAQVLPNHTNKARNFQQNYQKAKQTLLTKQSALAENLRQKLVKLLDDYNKTLASLHRRLINNGLAYSSVVTNATAQALQNYNAQVSDANTQHQNEMDILSAQVTALDSRYDEGVISLQNEFEQRVANEYDDLVYKEQKEKQRIDKYNTTLDEKETKYQASCQRALEYARQAEYERSLSASRLYAELGESGVEAQKLSEKLNFSKTYFSTWKRSEALAVIENDSFLASHLSSYYASFIDWINTYLIN